MCGDLQTLGDRREAEFGGNRCAIPFHERSADFKNLVAVRTDDLGDLRVGGAGVGPVIFFARADVDLSEQRTFRHDWQRAINRGARNRIVDHAGKIQELFGREMLGLSERGVEDGETLIGDAKAFFGEKVSEFFARGGDAHNRDFAKRRGGCQCVRGNRSEGRKVAGC